MKDLRQALVTVWITQDAEPNELTVSIAENINTEGPHNVATIHVDREHLTAGLDAISKLLKLVVGGAVWSTAPGSWSRSSTTQERTNGLRLTYGPEITALQMTLGGDVPAKESRREQPTG